MMNIRKEIEELIFNKYGLKVNDPFSIAKQGLKFIEELDELYEAFELDIEEKIECELGDCLFVEKTLLILFDLPFVRRMDWTINEPRISAISKSLNKCDSNIMDNIFILIHNRYEDYENNVNYNNRNSISYSYKSKTSLLQQTILKNQGRSGKIINGCYVKSEDI